MMKKNKFNGLVILILSFATLQFNVGQMTCAREQHSLIDTSIFRQQVFNDPNLYSFDDNNAINIKSSGIVILVKEVCKFNYTLSVKIRGKEILLKKNIKGISKVYIDKKYILFSAFTYSDEDGNNEGLCYLIKLSNNSTITYRKKLKNTCNPIVVNDNAYLVDGLTLIKTDVNFKSTEIVKIAFEASNTLNKYAYLDTYVICGLAKQKNSNIVINFSPKKSERCKSFTGTINSQTRILILKQKRS